MRHLKNAKVELCSYDWSMRRGLFMLELRIPENLPQNIDLHSPNFGCFLAWDARNLTAKQIAPLVEPLLQIGGVYFSCWGPDCERVHDVVDECESHFPDTDSVVITSWHAHESLKKALWFFLNCTWPDAAFEKSFRASIAISIGSESWASVIRSALRDPRKFSRDIVGAEDRDA